MKNTDKTGFKNQGTVDIVLRTRRQYPNIFYVRIFTLSDKHDLGWGPENVTRLALLCKN